MNRLSTGERSEALRRRFRERGGKTQQAQSYVNRSLGYLSRIGWMSNGGPVLNLGCGSGVTTGVLRSMGYNVIGVDLDSDALAVASDTHGNAGLVQARAERLPFGDNTFDLVLAEEVLEHVDDWERTLSQAIRVLRPEGGLVVSTSNRLCPRQNEVNGFPGWPWLPRSVQTRLLKRFEEEGSGRRYNFAHYPAIHWFTPWQLKAGLRSHGVERAFSTLDIITSADAREREWRWRLAIALAVPLRRVGLHELLYVGAPGLTVFGLKDS